MKVRRLVIGAIVVAVLGGGAWLGWRWYRASQSPEVPHIPLEGADQAVVNAVEKARDEVRRQPRSADGWGNLAMVLAANGYEVQASTCFTHAARFDPKNPTWPYLHGSLLLKGNPQQGIPLLRQALAVVRDTDERAVILFRLVLATVEEGELTEAAGHLKALAELDPNDARLHYGRGLLAIAQDDRASAREHLGKVLNSPSTRKRAHELLATLTEGDKQLAKTYQEQAAQPPPDAAWPDPFESLQARHKVTRSVAARLEPYWEMERSGQLMQGASYLRQLVAEEPDAEACYSLGFALYRLNDFPGSVAAFRQALGFDPRNAKSHLFMGAALLGQGEQRLKQPGGTEPAKELFRQAVAAEDQALTIQTNLAYAHYVRGRALKHLGRTNEAVRALNEAVLCQPEAAEMHLALGELLAETGQLAKGIGHLEDAVKLAGPNDTRPRTALEKWRPKLKTPP